MATLALGAVGAAAGGALLPAGVTAFGTTIGGAAIGQAVGASIGSAIDNALFAPLASSGGAPRVLEVGKVRDLHVSISTEGATIARAYGRVRLPGQLIWATDFEEEATTISSSTGGGGGGGKGFGGSRGGGGQDTTQVEYRYYVNLAYGLAEGEITRVGRIWADGKELNQSDYTIRLYKGTETQMPDSLIEAVEGAGNAPAYRGTAYIVFERLPIERFGRHVPQFSFEVFRAVDDFEKKVTAITIIPSAGEFAYETTPVARSFNAVSVPENLHTSHGSTDWSTSMDQLEDQLPNVTSASLFVSWFGDDLRAGACTLRPKVDAIEKETIPKSWSAAGLVRSTAQRVSLYQNAPAYGGTPSDASVVVAIQDLKARGKNVVFTPFILMDVPEANGRQNPYTGAAAQPAYPWRGRITVDPAPGQSGSPDKAAIAATQIASFVGTAAVGDFSVSGESVSYSGPNEWSYRRMILHYAHLCVAAGGVDAFVIGSEMRGLTQVRESASSYPFVAALVALAADVKNILGSGTIVTYAADWSEYFGHQPSDGSGDVYFSLDPLWSSNHIDVIAIDNYWPLSDWRDGDAHLDAQSGDNNIYDVNYLKNNIAGGEGYDWYYASTADRDNQIRTPITDGQGKPWIFRFKDIKSWWQNQHFDRPGGIESSSPTAWVPQAKPFWFTEVGCPAVDKGANQPNVFIDPKSAESKIPYYSRRTRDDLMQRRYLQAFYEYYDTSHEDYVAGSNPTSAIYSAPMVDIAKVFAYTWDARPFPAFPQAQNIWADGGNWELGHWLTGRMAGGPLAAVVSQIMLDYGFEKFSAGGLSGNMDGYAVDQIMSAREALQPLELAFFFDSFESGGIIEHAHRGQAGSVAELAVEDLAETGQGADLYSLTRAQETELPQSAKLIYIDGNTEYRQAAVESRRLVVQSQRVSVAQMPIVISQAQAQQIAETWLQESWVARETARFTLPPSWLALEPGDVVTLQAEGREFPLRITQTTDGDKKAVEARTIEAGIFEVTRTAGRREGYNVPAFFGPAIGVFLDLPLTTGEEVPHAGWVGAFQSPWPGAVAFFRSPSDTGYQLNRLVTGAATLGVTANDFMPGPEGRYDKANVLRVLLHNGALQSVSDVDLFAGSNLAAVENAAGGWEVIQFRDANLVDEKTYDLSMLLRAQGGTEDQMRDPVAPGARFVLLDEAITQADMSADEIGLAYNWRYGPSNRDIGDLSFKDQQHAFTGRGLKPQSPVHVKTTNQADDLTIHWIRRTRSGGDRWDTIEVPLQEDIEAYEVDIMNGSQVVRTLVSTMPSVLYSASAQISDFGTTQPSYTIRVYQLSATQGRGTARHAVI